MATFCFKNVVNDVACVAGAWKKWAQENTGAPVLSFARYFQAPATQAMNDDIRVLKDALESLNTRKSTPRRILSAICQKVLKIDGLYQKLKL